MFRWYQLLAGHRIVLGVVLLLGGVVFSVCSAGINWRADLLEMFSSDSQEVIGLRRLADAASPMTQLRIDVHGVDAAVLPAAVQSLGEKLTASGEFRSVWWGAAPEQLAASYAGLVREAPILLDDRDLAELGRRLSGGFVEARFASVAAGLADPDGELRIRRLQADPLDVGGIINARLKGIGPSQSAQIQDGVLVSEDGGHAMIVVQPNAAASDTPASVKMLAALHGAVAETRKTYPGMDVWLVGPHPAYVENALGIRRDVAWISTLGSLAVGIAIAVYFRRVSTALICLIPPVIGLGLALGIAGMLHLTLPLLVLGFGGLLCGSTTDYGIQLIAACNRLVRARGKWDLDIPAAAVREMFGPISMSVATSVTGFAALALSASPGLRAMGLFVAGSTVCIWLVTFLVFPAFLGTWVVTRKLGKSSGASVGARSRWFWRIGLAGFVLLTGVLFYWAAGVRVDADARRLDGASQERHAEEQHFYETWGKPGSALAIIQDASPEGALTTLEQVREFLADQATDGMIRGVYSVAGVLPDRSHAEARGEAWRFFWTSERIAQARNAATSAAAKVGLRAQPFESSVTSLVEVPEIKPALERISTSPAALFPGLIQVSPTNVTVATIVETRGDLSPRMATSWAAELRLRFPSVAIVSGNLLMFDATDRARAEGESLGPWVMLAILLPLWIYFRRIIPAAIAALSLFVGLIWMLGTAQAVFGGLNLLSLVPILFTLGVAVDYGIYAASDPAHRSRSKNTGGNRLSATMLCALTTILGTGSMVAAAHPALRWIGLTLVSGVIGGCLASWLLVAPLIGWWNRPREVRWYGRLGGWAVRVGLVMMLVVLAIPPVAEFVMARRRPAETLPIVTDPVLREEIGGAAVWTCGSSWLRRRETIWELSVSGSPEQIGYASSALGSPMDLRIENEMLDQLDRLVPGTWARWVLLRGVAVNLLDLPEHVSPPLQREIWGESLAHTDPHAYLAPTYSRLLSYHALHDVSQMLIDNPLLTPQLFGCTGVVADGDFSGDGHLWLARNFDFEGGESFGRQKCVTYVHPDEGYAFATVAWPGLAGCVTGMNQQRIALFINAAATADRRRIGTPSIFVARDVLQHARTLDEAVAIIRGAQVFVSDIFVIGDGKTGRAVVVEKSPAKTAVWNVSGSAAVANHLVSPGFGGDPENRERISDGTTMQRWTRAEELLEGMRGRVTAGRMAELLRDKKGTGGKELGLGNRNAIDALIATHSVIMDVTGGRMWVAAWPHGEGAFVAVDVGKMLESVPPTTVESELSAPSLPADAIMENGQWELFLKSKASSVESRDAFARGDFPTACSAAREAIAANPHFYLGYELLGREEVALGQFTAARMDLDRALALDPPYASERAGIQEALKSCGEAK